MASSYFKLRILKKKLIAKKSQPIERLYSVETATMKTLGDKCCSDQACRVCLKAGIVPVFGNENYPDISEDIKNLAEIEILRDDDNPKYLCNACYSVFQAVLLFRETAKTTDRFLRKKLEQSKTFFYNEDYEKFEVALTAEDDLESVNDNGSHDSGKVKSPVYNCRFCRLEFHTATELMLHNNTKQHKNIKVQCKICQGLLTPQLYERHLERHRSASHLVCEICGKIYRKDNLVRHLQYHSFELPYKCKECPYRGRFKNCLQIHMRTHTGTKPFACEKCNIRFLTRSNLNRHLVTHGKDKHFKCTECGRGFYTKPDMDVHFKSIHAGIFDFECKLCGNKYVTRKAVMKHELRVHKRPKMSKGRTPLYLLSEYRKSYEEASK